MLHDLVTDPNPPIDREAFVGAAGSVSWLELAEQCRAFSPRLAELAGTRVALCFRPQVESYALLAALDGLGADVFLMDAGRSPAELAEIARHFRLGALVVPASTGADFEVKSLPGGEAGTGESTVTILTSGTTGPPKAVRHTWTSLSRPARRGVGGSPPRWLLAYRPHLYAGLQVMMQCWVDRGTLVVPDTTASAGEIVELMRAARVQYVSATASYWRRLLLLVDPRRLAELDLRQITLGGELVDQNVLDALRNRLPDVRLVHIYATTELGRCYSVTDGRDGFPLRFLDAPSADGIELRVEDGELWVRSANAMTGYDPLSGIDSADADWFHTGDLVEIRGDRVHFVGRRSDIINVGGNKVHPTEVEKVLRSVPGVADVRVYRKKSSLAGELVACDVVAEKGQDPDALRKALSEHCAGVLAEHQRPRLVRMVDEIELSDAGKKVRGTQ